MTRARPRRPFARRAGALAASVLAAACSSALAASAPAKPSERSYTAKDWLAMAKLPDWRGTWVPDVTDQFKQHKTNVPAWTPAVARQIDEMERVYAAGHPTLILKGCLPLGMPNLMTITHNALEFLFTPGRVTVLGEADGNRLRRIYTDGRGHPEDPDLTFHGHSIGRWEGGTLVVDTVGIAPESYIATDEAVGVPNNGDMRIVEHIHLIDANTLADDLEITAPKVLSAPWKTRRLFHRQRGEKYEIVEGECEQGAFTPAKDRYGNAILKPVVESEDGSVVPRGQ